MEGKVGRKWFTLTATKGFVCCFYSLSPQSSLKEAEQEMALLMAARRFGCRPENLQVRELFVD